MIKENAVVLKDLEHLLVGVRLSTKRTFQDQRLKFFVMGLEVPPLEDQKGRKRVPEEDVME